MKRCVRGHDIARGETYYQQITAWVANGKRDSVTLRKDVEPWKFVCRKHMKEWQTGIAGDQGTLV